jgi:predicted phage gp36 major capsid-like protein
MQDIVMPEDVNVAMNFRILELEARCASLERVLSLPHVSEALKGQIRPYILNMEEDLRALHRGLERMFWI